MLQHVRASLTSAAKALQRLLDDQPTLEAVVKAGDLLIATFRQGGRVYSCGNGGSLCDAMHFAEELSGKFRQDRRALPALAISDAAHITCAGNDFGFETIFSRFVDAHGRPGDALLAISTSGTSKNVIAAAESARRLGVKVLVLTGRPNSPLGKLADIEICTQADTPWSDRVQELHIKVIHTLIELCERGLFPEKAR